MKKSNVPTPYEIWAILKEISKQQRKTERLVKQIQLNLKDLSERQKKTDEQIQELAKRHKDSYKPIEEPSETDNPFDNLRNEWEETDNQFGILGKDRRDLSNNLMRGPLAKSFQERGIKIDSTIGSLVDPNLNFDKLGFNEKEIVVIKIQCKLDTDDVQRFLSEMKIFKKDWSNIICGKKIYGALAFLVSGEKKAISQAKKKGFFVISAIDNVIIQNKKNFKPYNFLN